MKVLNQVSPAIWKHRHIVRDVELEVETDDISFYPCISESYAVKCAVCEYVDVVSKAFIPEDVRHRIWDEHKRINTK